MILLSSMDVAAKQRYRTCAQMYSSGLANPVQFENKQSQNGKT